MVLAEQACRDGEVIEVPAQPLEGDQGGVGFAACGLLVVIEALAPSGGDQGQVAFRRGKGDGAWFSVASPGDFTPVEAPEYGELAELPVLAGLLSWLDLFIGPDYAQAIAQRGLEAGQWVSRGSTKAKWTQNGPPMWQATSPATQAGSSSARSTRCATWPSEDAHGCSFGPLEIRRSVRANRIRSIKDGKTCPIAVGRSRYRRVRGLSAAPRRRSCALSHARRYPFPHRARRSASVR